VEDGKNEWLFEYFQELAFGQCGWGIEYNGWLEIVKGWKFIGCDRYQKVKAIKMK